MTHEDETRNFLGDPDNDFDDDYDGPEPACTHCGGDGFTEANEAYNDYVNYGDEYTDCPYCRGTGLRKHQTVF